MRICGSRFAVQAGSPDFDREIEISGQSCLWKNALSQRLEPKAQAFPKTVRANTHGFGTGSCALNITVNC
jgi:hypothetical protein